MDVMSRIDPGYTAWRGKILWELNKVKTFSACRDHVEGSSGMPRRPRCSGTKSSWAGICITYRQSVLLSGTRNRGQDKEEVKIH